MAPTHHDMIESKACSPNIRTDVSPSCACLLLCALPALYSWILYYSILLNTMLVVFKMARFEHGLLQHLFLISKNNGSTLDLPSLGVPNCWIARHGMPKL